jgi:saccharopine dehydrogenase-like NADP-dependent oxidoreductase
VAEVLELPRRDPPSVLIVGGSGSVGRRIAGLLGPQLGEHLVLGGRNPSRAADVARRVGARVLALDIGDATTFESALEGVALVVMCLDTSDLAFPHACVSRGIHYIDITASLEVIERLECLDDIARTQGAAILSSVGLAPGLTNLLAKACVARSPHPIASLDIHLLFGLGDHHGPAALEWMVDRLHQPFTSADAPEIRRWSFSERSQATFSAPFGHRATYRFNFSDQHTLRETLSLPLIRTWSTFDQAWLAAMLWRLAQLRLLRLTRIRPLRRATVWALGKLAYGTDRFAISVLAKTGDGVEYRATASGRTEAHGTAVIAAELVRQCLSEPPAPGVAQIDQRYSLVDFLPALTAQDIMVAVDAANDVERAVHG